MTTLETQFRSESQTYLEQWPPELATLSLPQVSYPLCPEEILIVGSNNHEWGSSFAPSPLPAQDLISVLDGMARRFTGGSFVRLGSRSPKDAWIQPQQRRVMGGADAFRNLTACSERMHDDLLLALAREYQPHVFLRAWQEIPPWTEFRCFMRNREIVGISQYFYRKDMLRPLLATRANNAIREFFPAFRDASHLDTVVFDVFVSEYGDAPTLLEINPFSERTDPCLFRDGNFDGSFRIASGVSGEPCSIA